MATALEGAGVARLVNNLGLTAGSCAATHLVQYGARVAPGRLRQKAFRRRPSGEKGRLEPWLRKDLDIDRRVGWDDGDQPAS
jgi:hypothetical protein